MKIYLVRHGKTILNKSNLVQGSIDSSLSEEGILQTRNIISIVKDLDIKYLYTGTLLRQKETADILFENSDLILRKELNNFNEANFGSNENVSIEETFNKINKTFNLSLRGFNDLSPILICDCLKKLDTRGNGENGESVVRRFKEGIDMIYDEAKENALIVSSGMAIGCLIESLCPDFHDYSVLNCSIHSLELIDGKYVVKSVFKGIK